MKNQYITKRMSYFNNYLKNKELLEVNLEFKEKIKQLEMENKDIIDDNETLIKDNEELKEIIDCITSIYAPQDIVDELNEEINELKKENNKLKDILEMNNKALKICNEAVSNFLRKK